MVGRVNRAFPFLLLREAAMDNRQPISLPPPYFALALGLFFIPQTVSLAQVNPFAFPLSEPPFPAQLAGIDREWNLSFKSAGKVRVVAAADLAYWGRYREVEAGPQVIL